MVGGGLQVGDLRLAGAGFAGVDVGLGGAAVVDLDVGLAVGDALRVAAAGTRRRGWRGLVDGSTVPGSCPHQMSALVEGRIVELRNEHPGWLAAGGVLATKLTRSSASAGRPDREGLPEIRADRCPVAA
jgi:hypothetical protein